MKQGKKPFFIKKCENYFSTLVSLVLTPLSLHVTSSPSPSHPEADWVGPEVPGAEEGRQTGEVPQQKEEEECQQRPEATAVQEKKLASKSSHLVSEIAWHSVITISHSFQYKSCIRAANEMTTSLQNKGKTARSMSHWNTKLGYNNAIYRAAWNVHKHRSKNCACM